MKKILLSAGLLALIAISFAVEVQGMVVKAIDEKINSVSGFLPYYLGADGNIHALLGKYTDVTVGDIYSAPVELFDAANVNSVITQYIKNPFKVSTMFKVAYLINRSNKSYYLWMIEVNPANVEQLKQSLLNQSGNDPAPSAIVDINLNAYIPGTYFGSKIRPGKTESLFTEFMKRSGFGLRSTLEMKMARGFSDLFQAFTANKNQVAMAFPVTDVKRELTKLANALNNLAAALKPEEVQLFPESSSSEVEAAPEKTEAAAPEATPVISSENAGLTQETQSEEPETFGGANPFSGS